VDDGRALSHDVCEFPPIECDLPHVVCGFPPVECEFPHDVCEFPPVECAFPHDVCELPPVECAFPHDVCELPPVECDLPHDVCERTPVACTFARVPCEAAAFGGRDRSLVRRSEDGDTLFVMTRSASSIAELEKQAERLRAELKVPNQNEVFRAAVEAGYLVAHADGTFDDTERETLVKAIEILSVGAVIEWEVETLLDECEARSGKDGGVARAKEVGKELKKLGSAEAGILIAAAVALATKKVDKKEAEMLKAVGAGAGIKGEDVLAIVKRAS
jgi:tellurite resistance protein